MKDSDYCEIKDVQHTLFYHAFHLHDEGELSPPGFSSEFFLCREILSFLSVVFHCSLRALRHLLCDFPVNLFLQPQGQVMLRSITLYMQHSVLLRHFSHRTMTMHFICQRLAVCNLCKQRNLIPFFVELQAIHRVVHLCI